MFVCGGNRLSGCLARERRGSQLMHHQNIGLPESVAVRSGTVGWKRVCLFVCCLTSQQQACVSQGRICTDNFTCCHTEIEVADQTFYLTKSQYTYPGPTRPSAHSIMPGAWQGANFEVTGMTRLRENPGASGIQTPDLLLSRRTP